MNIPGKSINQVLAVIYSVRIGIVIPDTSFELNVIFIYKLKLYC